MLEESVRAAFSRQDAKGLRELFQTNPKLREGIDAPLFPFDAPAIVAFAKDPAMVDVLLDFGADPNRRSDWWAGGFHALHHATGATAERLIARGAIPDACAAANIDRPDLLAKLLADDPSRVHERGGDGQTPLHFARSRAVVDILLNAGADIDARDVDHRSTPAEWMLNGTRGAGRYDIARYLVERGASADIFLATALGLTDRVRSLITANPRVLNERTGQGIYAEQPPSSYHIYFWTIGEGLSPMDVAVRFEQNEVLQLMLGVATPVQRLVVAAHRGDEARAKEIVRENPGVIESMTAHDHRAVSDAAWHGNARAVALMLDLGFDPRTPGQDSGTALHCAAWAGSPETVAALLRSRDAKDLIAVRDAQYNATPLNWCFHGPQHGDPKAGHADVARLLLGAGAAPGAEFQASSPVVAEVKEWRARR